MKKLLLLTSLCLFSLAGTACFKDVSVEVAKKPPHCTNATCKCCYCSKDQRNPGDVCVCKNCGCVKIDKPTCCEKPCLPKCGGTKKPVWQPHNCVNVTCTCKDCPKGREGRGCPCKSCGCVEDGTKRT